MKNNFILFLTFAAGSHAFVTSRRNGCEMNEVQTKDRMAMMTLHHSSRRSSGSSNNNTDTNSGSFHSSASRLISEFDPLNLSGMNVVRENRMKLASTTVSDDGNIPDVMGHDYSTLGGSNPSTGVGIWAARAILLLVAMIWGTNFASVKYIETLCFAPPCAHMASEAALARFGVAALVGLPFLFGKQKEVIQAGLECGALISAGYITQAMALQTIPSARCAFICSLTVVVVPFMSALLENKPIKPVHIISGVLALCGISVLEGMVDIQQLIGAGDAGLITTGHHITPVIHQISNNEMFGIGVGDLIALGQPFGFGLAFMRIEHYVEKYRDVEGRIMTMSAAQCLAVGLLSIFWVLFDYQGSVPDLTYMIEPHYLAAIGKFGIPYNV